MGYVRYRRAEELASLNPPLRKKGESVLPVPVAVAMAQGSYGNVARVSGLHAKVANVVDTFYRWVGRPWDGDPKTLTNQLKTQWVKPDVIDALWKTCYDLRVATYQALASRPGDGELPMARLSVKSLLPARKNNDAIQLETLQALNQNLDAMRQEKRQGRKRLSLLQALDRLGVSQHHRHEVSRTLNCFSKAVSQVIQALDRS